jgi:hypothetical protein
MGEVAAALDLGFPSHRRVAEEIRAWIREIESVTTTLDPSAELAHALAGVRAFKAALHEHWRAQGDQ